LCSTFSILVISFYASFFTSLTSLDNVLGPVIGMVSISYLIFLASNLEISYSGNSASLFYPYDYFILAYFSMARTHLQKVPAARDTPVTFGVLKSGFEVYFCRDLRVKGEILSLSKDSNLYRN